MKPIQWTLNHMPKSEDRQLSVMSRENVKRARGFHQSFPEYSVTPLQRLKALADKLGVKEVFVKDESYRFGLNAFDRSDFFSFSPKSRHRTGQNRIFTDPHRTQTAAGSIASLPNTQHAYFSQGISQHFIRGHFEPFCYII